VVCGGSRQDHDCSLAQADTSLGQAEGLAALFSWRCAHKGSVGGDLVGRAQTGREQDQQRAGQAGLPEEQGQNRAGGDGEQAHDAQPCRRSHEAAKHDGADGLAQSHGGQDHADGGRAAAEIPGQRGDHAFRSLVECRQPAEQHRHAQGRAGEDEADTSEDAGQMAGLMVAADRGRLGGS
jgi:hypothetical protein